MGMTAILRLRNIRAGTEDRSGPVFENNHSDSRSSNELPCCAYPTEPLENAILEIRPSLARSDLYRDSLSVRWVWSKSPGDMHALKWRLQAPRLRKSHYWFHEQTIFWFRIASPIFFLALGSGKKHAKHRCPKSLLRRTTNANSSGTSFSDGRY